MGRADAPARRGHRLLAKLLLAAASLAATLLVAELVIRWFLPVAYMAPAEEEEGGVWQQTVNRRSSIPGLDYELRPGISAFAVGASIHTNSAGMRDRERTKAKPPGAFRIAVLGDSFTFGFGVESDATYPAQLETLLNEGGGRRFEVLNFGVGGYSTRDEAIVLRHRAIEWNPDLVVVGYVANDPETDPTQPLNAYFRPAVWWQHSHLLRLVAQKLNHMDVERWGGGDYCAYLHRAPWKWKTVLDAFDDMRAVTAEKRVKVVVAVFPVPDTIFEQVRNAAVERGFVVVRLPFGNYPEDSLFQPDGHPNALGHRVTAQAIRDALVREQLVPR